MQRMQGATTRETVKFWQARDLERLELLRATYVTHSFARHAHDGFAIGVIEAGAEQFYYRGSTHIAPSGAIIVINPGETHTGQAAARSGWAYRMLYPDTTLLRRVASGVAGYSQGIPHFPSPVIHDNQLSAALRRLHLTLETSPSALERQSRLLATLALLVTRYADSPRVEQVVRREQTGVRRVRQYLDAYYGENVSLDDLARLAGLSPFHLSRVFAREVRTPAAHLPDGSARRSRQTAAPRRTSGGRGRARDRLRRPEPPDAPLQAHCRRDAGAIYARLLGERQGLCVIVGAYGYTPATGGRITIRPYAAEQERTRHAALAPLR